MRSWFLKLDIVQAALLGLYSSLFPSIWIMVKVSESNAEIGSFGFLFMLYGMMGAPTIGCMFFNHLLREMHQSKVR